jgi:hypothetical protein
MLSEDLISCCKIKPALFQLKIKGQAGGDEWSRRIIQPGNSYVETEKGICILL